MSFVSMGMYLALLIGVYRMVRLKISAVVAFVAVLVLLTRTDLLAFALALDARHPFLNLIVWAAVLELKRPRRGVAPLVLLGLAGLLRPEAWLLSGIYWLWLVIGKRSGVVWMGALVVLPPLIWVGLDWWIAHDPLYSFVSTRDVAGQLDRQKSLLESITLIPRFVGGSEPLVNTAAGTAGIALAIYALRSRMFMLAALAASGVITYLLIAIGGLSVIERYLLLPSLVACIGVAFALAGWMQVTGALRRPAIAVAVITLGLIAFRVPSYVSEFEAFNTSWRQTSSRFARHRVDPHDATSRE